VRSNCLVFALALLWRRRKARRRFGRSWYLLMRRSRLAAKSPHLLYGEDRADGSVRLVSYVPRNPRAKRVPPPWFRGMPRWGDRKQQPPDAR